MRLWMGAAANRCQNSFERVLRRQSTAPAYVGGLGALRLMAAFYGELWRNLRLVRRGLSPGPVSTREHGWLLVASGERFYETSWARVCPKHRGLRWRRGGPVGGNDPRPIAGRLSVVSVVGEAPRLGLNPRTTWSLVKDGLRYSTSFDLAPADWYFEGGDSTGACRRKRGCPHNCCYCVLHRGEGKAGSRQSC